MSTTPQWENDFKEKFVVEMIDPANPQRRGPDALINISIPKLKSFISLALQQERHKNNRLTADIAHAIGYCRGLGHPETYLEKQYPDLLDQPKKE